MTTIDDKQRTKSLLMNWRRWSLDCNPDYSEVYYYRVSPDFAGTPCTANKNPPPPPYDSDAALLVEDALRLMFRPYKAEYDMLRDYYALGFTQKELADDRGTSRRTIGRRLAMAERIFAQVWSEFIRK